MLGSRALQKPTVLGLGWQCSHSWKGDKPCWQEWCHLWTKAKMRQTFNWGGSQEPQEETMKVGCKQRVTNFDGSHLLTAINQDMLASNLEQATFWQMPLKNWLLQHILIHKGMNGINGRASSKSTHGLSAFLCQCIFYNQHLLKKNKAQTNQPPDEIAKATCSSPKKQSRSLLSGYDEHWEATSL